MKIVEINAVFGFLSTGIIVRDIENLIEKSGNTAFVVYQDASSAPKNGYMMGNVFDWKYHAIYSRVFGKQAYASVGQTKKLLRYFDKIKPDIVHLHNLHSNYINLNLLLDYLAKNNIGVVITMHDCWYFTGKCSHYVAYECDRWKNKCGNCPQLKNEVPSIFFDKTRDVLLDRTSHINKIKNLALVGCSNWITEQAKQSRLKPRIFKTVYNGVDTDIFSYHQTDYRKKQNIEDNFIILGMADKWFDNRNKSVVELILKSLSEDDRIIICGNVDENNPLTKDKHFIFAGYVSDRNELSDIYSASNVFVNLTRADTLPTVNMESICCGTPVITFDACGSPELVDEGKTGFIVKTGDSDKIVDSIKNVKKISFDNREISDIGIKKFDKNENYKAYLDLFNKLLETKNNFI